MPRAAKKDAPAKKRKEPEEEEDVEEDEAEEKPKKKATSSKKAKSEKDNAGESAPKIETDWKKPEKKDDQLKIASWNVAGWAAIIKKGFQEYVKNEDPDIICLQETKIEGKNVKEPFLEGYHQHFYAAEQKGYSGTAIFSKVKPLSWKDGIGIEEHDKEGRVITAEYENFFLVNTYIPNSSRGLVNLDYRQKWDKDFLEFLKKLDKQKPVIWTGDLNVAHLEIDLANPKANRNKTAGFTDQERNGMTQVLKSGFVDSFRHLYPKEEGVYSYWTYVGNARAKNIGWRLDYWIISQRLVERLGDTVMRPGVMGSDHCPIVLLIGLKDGKLLPYVENAAPVENKPAENSNNNENKEEPKKEESKAEDKKEESKTEEKPADKKKAAPKKGKKGK